jgi:hypothetical protein
MAFAHIAICDECGKEVPVDAAFPEWGEIRHPVCPLEDSSLGLLGDSKGPESETASETGWVLTDTAETFCSETCLVARSCRFPQLYREG